MSAQSDEPRVLLDGVTDNQHRNNMLITRNENDPRRITFDEWHAACAAVGQPVCAFTKKPLTGELIYFTRCCIGFLGMDGVGLGRFVPVLASALEHVIDSVTLRSDIPITIPITTCPNCGARFHGRSQQLGDGLQRFIWTFDARSGEAMRACTWWCYHTIAKRRRKARVAERRGDPNRECESCGGTFSIVRTDQRYCSAACKQRVYRTRSRQMKGTDEVSA